MIAILALVGAVAGWGAHPWIMNLARARAPEEVDVRDSRWLSPVVITAGSAAAGGLWLAELPTVLRITYFAAAVIGWWLLCFDVALHKLPNPLVGALGAAIAIGYLGLYVTDAAPLRQVLTAALAGALGLAGFAVLALVRKAAMGLGDVKLAGVLGLATGWYGLAAAMQWVLASFLLGGAIASVLLITRRLDPKATIAFGPWLLLGAAVAIALNASAGMTH